MVNNLTVDAKPGMSKWILYNIITCFAVYWLSNLVLWYPWSINEKLGQVIMLTVNPLLWGIASYNCIIKYPNPRTIMGVLQTSVIFVVESIASDLIFFVLIRNAKDKLMHITTLYAWCFVFFLPFIIYVIFRKSLTQNRKPLLRTDFRTPLIIGLVSFIAITVIIILDVKFT